MRSIIFPIGPLLFGLGVLLMGNGLLSILLGLESGEAFGETVTGVIMGGYFLGLVAGTFLIPIVIKNVGYIRTFAAMAALASVAAVAHGVFIDSLGWWALRVISGLCLAGIYLVVESWLNMQSTNVLRGRIFGIYMTITLVAMGLGLFLGAWAGSPDQLEPYILASVLFTLGLIPVVITPMPQPEPAEIPSTDFRQLLSASPTGFAGAFIAGILNGVFWGLGPVFWRGIGLSEGESAAFMALVVVGGALLQWPIGQISDRHDRRWVLAGVSMSAALVVLIILPAVHLPRSLLALCALGYGGLMLSVYSLSVAHVNDRIPAVHILESTRTLLLLYGIGAATGPLVAGPVMELYGAPSLALFSAGGLIFLTLVVVQQVHSRKPVPVEEQGAFIPLTRTSQVVMEVLPEIAELHPDTTTEQHE